MIRKMPFILFILMIGSVLSSYWMPEALKSFFYGISLSLKSVIMFLLPFLIFSLLFQTATRLAKEASKWILFLLAFVCLSNFTSTMLSFLVGKIAYSFDLNMVIPKETLSLNPSFNITLPSFIANSHALFAGLTLGILSSLFFPSFAKKTSSYLNVLVNCILKTIFGIIPFFLVGFMIKLTHDGMMKLILTNYLLIFAFVACAVYSYIFLLYGLINRFEKKAWGKSLKNMLPAAIAGFGSMSSAAAMPLSLLGVEKNSENPEMSKSIIPLTVNIHLIGDCFAIPIFAFAILKSFGMASPDLTSYLLFAVYFVLAKFSVAAVPGGGVIVMLPILGEHLGLNGEMLSLITALYILFDPITTPANILGNGAIATGLGNLFKRNKKSPALEKS